jgi:hypothetical protein
MRDSAFVAGDRFTKDSFTSQVGKVVPLKFGDEVIGEAKLLSVIVNEGSAQAVFDFTLSDDASFNWRQKQRGYAIVEDRTCRCRCDDGKSPH